MNMKKTQSIHINLSMKKEFAEKLDKLVKSSAVSRSEFIRTLIRREFSGDANEK